MDRVHPKGTLDREEAMRIHQNRRFVRRLASGAALALAMAVVLGGFVVLGVGPFGEAEAADGIVYQSKDCSCCHKWAPFMEREGYKFDTEYSDNLSDIKEWRGVPSHLTACHTTVLHGYTVEGHVPVEAVLRLMEEQPDVDGIALPGMPAGSPGMGGYQQAPFEVHWFKGDDHGLWVTV